MCGSHDADINPAYVVHDKLRDKIYLDMRQTFSIWFIPMYHAHVRLVTVLDLVDSDSPDYHDPLDRMLKQEEEREGGATNGASQPHRNGSRNNNHHNHRHNGSRSSNHHHHHKHGSCTWKISKQEDLYQVTDFLKFAGGPGPFPFLWYLFQLGASAACVFLSLLLLATPWAFQKEPARGGVEATVECVESPTSPTSTLSGDQETEGADDPDAADNSGSRNRELGGGDSVPEKGPSHVNHGSASGGPVGGNADGGSNDNNNDNNNKSNSDNNHNNGTNHPSTNGHRRESSNSKVSSSGPKKSRKNANNGKKKAAAA